MTIASLATWAVPCLLPIFLGFWGHARLRTRRHRRRQSLALQLGLLRRLLGGLQRHRGLSNGLLSGDTGLRRDLEMARRDLDRTVDRIRTADFADEAGWAALLDHWSRLRERRATDPANNLAQHNRLIRNTIVLIEDVALGFDYRSANLDAGLYTLVWRDVVRAAEWAGQARALGMGMAASGVGSAGQRVRMRFLHQQILAFSATAKRLDQGEPSTFDLARCEAVLDRFVSRIERNLLGETIDIEPRVYFREATEAIDALLAVVDEALGRLSTETYVDGLD